jgi:hypothetical protein
MTPPRSPMEAAAYRIPVAVHSRAPGSTPSGAPSGAWLQVATIFAALDDSPSAATGNQEQSEQGSKTVRGLRLRVRWFPGWQQVLLASRRILLEDGISYDIRGAVEVQGGGTERLLSIIAQAVTQ